VEEKGNNSVKNEDMTPFARPLGFTSFMAGLLAKSVIELIKGLFKSIFKT